MYYYYHIYIVIVLLSQYIQTTKLNQIKYIQLNTINIKYILR